MDHRTIFIIMMKNIIIGDGDYSFYYYFFFIKIAS